MFDKYFIWCLSSAVALAGWPALSYNSETRFPLMSLHDLNSRIRETVFLELNMPSIFGSTVRRQSRSHDASHHGRLILYKGIHEPPYGWFHLQPVWQIPQIELMWMSQIGPLTDGCASTSTSDWGVNSTENMEAALHVLTCASWAHVQYLLNYAALIWRIDPV